MVRSKKCFKCGQEKPRSEFYSHPKMGDGLLGKCRQCAKTDAKEHRDKNIVRIRKYDRDRAKNPERRKAAAAISNAWRIADKRRLAAHNAVTRALRSGKLVRRSCERCGREDSLAHHEDYDNKLAVTWLCQPCHKLRHKEMKLESF